MSSESDCSVSLDVSELSLLHTDEAVVASWVVVCGGSHCSRAGVEPGL